MDEDFERRREARRQKREEMRIEAERFTNMRTDDDDEEAARERRRRARQERLRSVETSNDTPEVNNTHSVSEVKGGGGDEEEEEQALQDRVAKREARRQQRLKEAQERQKDTEIETPARDEERSSFRRGRSYEPEPEPEPEPEAVEQEVQEEEVVEEEEEEEVQPAVEEEEREEEKPRRSYRQADTESTEQSENSGETGGRGQIDSANKNEAGEDLAPPSAVEVPESSVTENGVTEHKAEAEAEEEKKEEEKEEEEIPEVNDDEGLVSQENGGYHEEASPRHKKPERTTSRGSLRSPEAGSASPSELGGGGGGGGGSAEDEEVRQEAERKLEELRRRRDETESEEFERMRQKQQGAEVELEELKKKREERRRVQEEEDRQRKQEEEDRKAREEEEKKRMKEEIERRRAEAAEKRQRAEDTDDGEGKGRFKCISPRGSSLKIGERAEFLNKSAQKSAVKTSFTPVVSKIDNRLEQYTSAAQSKEFQSRSGASDLPVVTDGIRNIKSMWEKGNVFNSNSPGGATNKDAAGIKVGVAGRINDWLNKTPESGKSPGGRPVDLKPGDVTGKRSLWENIGSSPVKVSGRGECKSVANGMGH